MTRGRGRLLPMLGWLLFGPACTFYVAYEIESEPTGLEVYTPKGQRLGRTPLVVVESGTSEVYTGGRTRCVEGERTFVLTSGAEPGRRLRRTFTLPRTCVGLDRAAQARKRPEHRFVLRLEQEGDAAQESAEPMPAPPAGPRRMAGVDPEDGYAGPSEPTVFDSVLQASEAPVERLLGRNLLITGLVAFAASWSPMAATAIGANADSGGDCPDCYALLVPIVGPALAGHAALAEGDGCSLRPLCGLSTVIGFALVIDAVVQAVGLGLALAGMSLLVDPGDPAQTHTPQAPVLRFAPAPMGTAGQGLLLEWRF